jgi:hypothetical protein
MRGGLHDSQESAEAFAKAQTDCVTTVVHRPGTCVKCSAYCDAAAFCSQWHDNPQRDEEVMHGQ